MVSFDIFQTIGPKDKKIIQYTNKVNGQNVVGYDNMHHLSESNDIKLNNSEAVDAGLFPFTYSYIKEKMVKKNRAGWVYAQLVKLYYPQIQNKKEYVLVVDSDVFFTRKLNFFDGNNRPYFTTSNEFHEPYFSHMDRVHPNLTRESKKSGISHHMMFSKEILTSLFNMVEKRSGKKFYDVYLEEIDSNEESPSADYEMYFHYVLKNFKNDYSVRELNWKNVSRLNDDNFNRYDMVSLPHYSGSRPENFFYNLKKLKFNRVSNSLNNFYYVNFKL
jgi:L-rhamnose mutarotase